MAVAAAIPYSTRTSPVCGGRAQTIAVVAVASPTATSSRSAALAGVANRARTKATTDHTVLRRPLSGDDGFQVGQDLPLEVVQRLPEHALEVLATVLPVRERPEVVDHAREALALDEIVGHQEGQLVGRQRALAAGA